MHNPTTQSPPLLLHNHQHHHHQQQQPPQVLSPCSSGRRSSSASNSPEFEFWMVRNPTQPQPDLLSADQLFLNGVLLPLHLLHLTQPVDAPPDDDPPTQPEIEAAQDAPPEPSPRITDTLVTEPPSTSKRWTDIFKKSEKKGPIVPAGSAPEEKRKREKKPGSGNLAELNINLWPFSRSRSEGNGAALPRLGAGVTSTRRVSSAPCSRSNSGGDPKSRKWPGSPARPGLHLGRTSPVWQVKRGPRTSNELGEPRRISKAPRGGGSRKARVLNLNVPMCIGYRHHLSCRTDDNVGLGRATTACDGDGNGGTSAGSSSGNMFNLRSIFTKKVH